jgi:hypothetical protein
MRLTLPVRELEEAEAQSGSNDAARSFWAALEGKSSD